MVAPTLYALSTSYMFICCLVLFKDILGTLAQISTAFQKDHVRFGSVMRDVAALKEWLAACFKKGDFKGSSTWRDLQKARLETTTSVGGSECFDFKGVPRIKFDEAAEKKVRDGVSDFAASLIVNLDERFPANSSSVISALDAVFNLDAYPESRGGWDLVKSTYGDAELEIVLAHFGTARNSKSIKDGPAVRFDLRRVDPDLVRVQWPILRGLLFEARQQMLLKGVSREDAYKRVLETSSLADAKMLLSISLVLCLSTVWCERGFSLMAIIKTKLRNCMNMETLDALMMVSMHSPEFTDPVAVALLVDEALAHWKKKLSATRIRATLAKQAERRNRRRRCPSPTCSKLKLARRRRRARLSTVRGSTMSH